MEIMEGTVSHGSLLTSERVLAYQSEGTTASESQMIKRTCLWLVNQIQRYAQDKGFDLSRLTEPYLNDEVWRAYTTILKQALANSPWLILRDTQYVTVTERLKDRDIIDIITSPKAEDHAISDYMEKLRSALLTLKTDIGLDRLDNFFQASLDRKTSAYMFLIPTYRDRTVVRGALVTLSVDYGATAWLDLLEQYLDQKFNVSTTCCCLSFLFDMDTWDRKGKKATARLEDSIFEETVLK